MASAFSHWLMALQWYVGLHVLALLFWPWTQRVCRHAPDRGAALALPGGIFGFVLLQQLVWRFGWRLGMDTPHSAWFWLWTGLAGGLGWWRFPGTRVLNVLAQREAWRGLQVFAIGFWCWTLIRAANPGVSHTEQPMNLMWMQASMVSHAPPIADAWLGGAPATYYAEGHQMLGFFATLFGTPARIAVNLGQITWFALTLNLVFATASRLGQGRYRKRPSGRRGLIGIFFFFAANPVGAWHAWGGGDPGDVWWWSATRVLFDGDTAMITEFPFFSFWLGDNHAHMLGIPILLLSILAGIHFRHAPTLSLATGLSLTLPIVWSWRTNAWQTPTALALPVLFLLLRILDKRPKHSPPPSFYAGLLLPLALLFTPGGDGMFQGLARNTFGIRNPFFLLLVFGVFAPALLPLILPLSQKKHTKSAALWLVLLGLGMLTVCEVVYVRDIYQSRMNTVFKVYYQVWILWALAAAAGWHTLHTHTSRKLRLSAHILLLLLAFAWAYPLRLAGPALRARPKSLDAFSRMPPPQRALLESATRLIQPGQLIIEAPGNSFEAHTSLLGTWTAGNTLIGWRGHQDQWRPGHTLPDPAPLYLAESESELQAALDAFQPDWILLGPREHMQYEIHPQWHTWMLRRFDLLHTNPVYRLYGNTP